MFCTYCTHTTFFMYHYSVSFGSIMHVNVHIVCLPMHTCFLFACTLTHTCIHFHTHTYTHFRTHSHTHTHRAPLTSQLSVRSCVPHSPTTVQSTVNQLPPSSRRGASSLYALQLPMPLLTPMEQDHLIHSTHHSNSTLVRLICSMCIYVWLEVNIV